MDFGALRPEITSALMYAGAGSGPMLAAASAWNSLSAELRSTAAAYQSVVSGLTGDGWMGPASVSMAAAAAPYVVWVSTTAAQAEQTAIQANAAAAAYEAAFAMTVPPPVIAANRAQLASLVATNVLGQNTPAIAAAEALYGEFWAQDAAAMYGYAGNSAAASKFTPFFAPRQATNPAGPVIQSAAVGQATGTAAATNTQTALSQFTSAVPTTLQSLASPAASGSGGFLGSPDTGGLGPNANIWNTITSSGNTNPAVITSMMADMAMVSALQQGGFGGLAGPSSLLPGPGVGALGATQLVSQVNPGVSAGLGRATSIGALSVPQSWAATPVANSTVTPFPGTNWTGAVPDAEAGGMPGMPGMPMTGSGGRGFGFAAPRYGFKPTVMARPVIAG